MQTKYWLTELERSPWLGATLQWPFPQRDFGWFGDFVYGALANSQSILLSYNDLRWRSLVGVFWRPRNALDAERTQTVIESPTTMYGTQAR